MNISKLSLGLWVVLFAIGSGACVSMGTKDESDKPPIINEDIATKDAVNAGIKYGNPTLKQVGALIKERKVSGYVGEYLGKQIQANYERWTSLQLINAVSLFQNMASPNSPELFSFLVQQDRTLAIQLAWTLAARVPSLAMAQVIEESLTGALRDGGWHGQLIPELAEALMANRLKSAYTLAREGLTVTHHPSFADAMSFLQPKQASSDFMDYLSLAPLDELRQLNMRQVNVLACTKALSHLIRYPATVTHTKIHHLFYFAISRNLGLAEMGRKVIESYLPENKNYLAFLLIKEPTWVQLAYIESSRRNLSPVLGLFLGEIKKVSAQREVIDEINYAWR